MLRRGQPAHDLPGPRGASLHRSPFDPDVPPPAAMLMPLYGPDPVQPVPLPPTVSLPTSPVPGALPVPTSVLPLLDTFAP